MLLHGYWRSTTSYRTRIALNLKGVAYRQATLDLRSDAHRSEAFKALNPQGLVPALEIDEVVLTQSKAVENASRVVIILARFLPGSDSSSSPRRPIVNAASPQVSKGSMSNDKS